MRQENKTAGQSSLSFIEAARRTQIINAAIETIATKGYMHASLAQIARQAGVSKGIISYHFVSKDELIEQVVIEVYTRALHFITPTIQRQSSATDQLQIYIQTDIAFIGAHRMEVTALSEIMTNFRTEEGKLRYDVQAEEPILAALEEFLRKGQNDGDFRTFNTRVMAITIRRAIDALPRLLVADPNLDLISYAQELGTLFHNATKKE